MLSPPHHLVGVLVVTLGGLWIAPTAVAQVDSCPSFPSSPSSPTPQELSGSDDPNLENFGFSVALDGETLAVGAPGHRPPDHNGNRGRVYIFTRDGTDWRRQAVLGPETSEDSEIQFGRAGALRGEVLAVGAPEGAVDSQDAAGRVYLFERDDGGTWSELGTRLTAGAANVREGAKFGFSLALDGDLLVVGAPFDPTRGRFAGAVFVFRKRDSGWTLEAGPLTARDTAAFDAFGTAVAVSGGRFVVGAPLHDEAGERGNSGAAYLFEPDGQGEWAERKILPGEGPAEDDLYGFAVAMDGDTVVVGARAGDTGRGADTGAAFVFTCGSAGCAEQARLAACDGQPGDELGAAVAVFEDSREDPAIDDGDLVVVGARRNEGAGRQDAGAAYIYRLIDGTWRLAARVSADSPASSDQAFGRAVAVAGPHVVAGESLRGEENAGSAHVFTAQADLGVTELGRDVDPVPGTEVTHRVTFRNEGPSPAIGAEVTVTFARKDPASATGPLLSGLTGDCQCQNEQCTEVNGLPPDVRSRRFTALVDLFPGGEVSCTVRPLVTPDARGELNVTAVITPPPTVEEPQSEELPNSREVTSTLQPRADLKLERTATPGVAVPGGNPNLYRFTVTNYQGPSDVLPGEAVVTTDFTVSEPGSDPLLIEWSCTADRGSCGPGTGGNVSDSIALRVGGRLTYVVRVRARPSDRGRIEGKLTVEAKQGLVDNFPNNNEKTVETRLEPRADLLVTLTEPLPEVGVPGGEPSQYEFTVTNNGPSDVLSGEVLVATTHVINGLPKDAPCTSDGIPREPIEGEVSDLITLQRDGMLSYDVTVQISPQDRGRLEGALAVVAMGGLADTNPSNNEKCVPIPLDPRADLAVTSFEGPDTAVPGARRPTSYSFQVTNVEGPSTVLVGEAEVAATFGEELTFDCVGGTEDGKCDLGNGNVLDCRFSEDDGRAHGCILRDSGFQLSPGGVLTYTVEARARPVLSPRVENKAEVSPLKPLGEPDNATEPNEAQVLTTFKPVKLELTKSPVGEDGDPLFCLQVFNQSDHTAEGIRLIDPSPPGLELMEIEGACNDSCSFPDPLTCSTCSELDPMAPDQGCFPCNFDSLRPEEQACLQVRFSELDADGPQDGEGGSDDPVNLASLAATTADPDAENNFAQSSTDAESDGDESSVTLTLMDAPIRIDNGEDVTYELEIDPVSTDTSLLLKITTGDGVNFDAPDPPPCETQQCPPSADPEAQCVTCRLGQLAGNGPASIQVTLSDVQTDENREVGIVERFLRSHFVVVTAETPDDGTPVSNTVEVLTAIGEREPADLALEAEVSEQPLPDGRLPVTLILGNAGPGPATGVRLEVRPGAADILRPDAVGLCEEVAPSELRGESDDSFVCLHVDPDPLVPGSVVLLPLTLEPDFGTVTFRVTTGAPDPQDNNEDDVGETDEAPASAQPTSLVPRRLGTSGPP